MNKEEIEIIEKEINSLNGASQCDLASGKEKKEWLDTANAMKKMLEENKQLKDNWNKLKELFDIQKESEEYDSLQWLEFQTTNYENDSIILHRYKILYNLILKSQQENKQLKEELEKADSITQSCIFQGKEESEISFRNCLNKMTDYKTRIDKAIEYLEHERFKRKILLVLYEKKYMKSIFNSLLEILKGE